jgi:hypothetical protein
MLDACSQAEFHSSQPGHRRGEFPALKVAHAFAVIAKFSVACFEGEPQPEARTIPAVPNVSPPSQIRAVPSNDAVTTRVPSGLKAAE